MKISNFTEKFGLVFAYFTCLLADKIIDKKCKGTPHFPNNTIMRQMLDKWRWEDGVDEPFFMEYLFTNDLVNRYPDTIDPNTKLEKLKPKKFSLSLDRDRRCPKSIKRLTRKKKMRQRSNCPWYYEMNYDQFRFPSIMYTARCKCDKCIGMDNINNTTFHSKCNPIVIQQKVLRVKTDSDGNHYCQFKTSTYELSKDVEDIAIGCTCVYQSPDKVHKGKENTKLSP